MATARAWIDEPMKRVALRARVLRPYRRLRFAAFGRESILHRPDWVYGPHRIEIGERVMVLGHVWLAAERVTWGQSEPAIRIGDGVAIRPYCTISASAAITIEDDVVISGFSTVVDSDHTYDGPSANVVFNPVRAEPIRIGRGSWIGERTAILRGAKVGRFCFIGANSVVRDEIPDFSVAVGAPARVVDSTWEQAQHLLDAEAPAALDGEPRLAVR